MKEKRLWRLFSFLCIYLAFWEQTCALVFAIHVSSRWILDPSPLILFFVLINLVSPFIYLHFETEKLGLTKTTHNVGHTPTSNNNLTSTSVFSDLEISMRVDHYNDIHGYLPSYTNMKYVFYSTHVIMWMKL